MQHMAAKTIENIATTVTDSAHSMVTAETGPALWYLFTHSTVEAVRITAISVSYSHTHAHTHTHTHTDTQVVGRACMSIKTSKHISVYKGWPAVQLFIMVSLTVNLANRKTTLPNMVSIPRLNFLNVTQSCYLIVYVQRSKINKVHMV